MSISDHPTVKAYKENPTRYMKNKEVFSSKQIKEMALEAGALDAGIIEIERPAVDEFRENILAILSGTQSILVLAYPVNTAYIRSYHHSIVDTEYKYSFQSMNKAARRLVGKLATIGIKALSVPGGFPFELSRFPTQVSITGDKQFAIEAGLGQMAHNRLLTHPVHGGAIILASVLLSNRCDTYDQPINFDACIHCGLCADVCPTGAISQNGDFNLVSCYTHNYRDKVSGFMNWIEQIADSRSAAEYRKKVSDVETANKWQSMAVNQQTQCDRCMAVCPAGEMNIADYLSDKKTFIQSNVKRFKEKEEVIYVLKDSDAEAHVKKRFPTKTIKHVSNSIRANSLNGFFDMISMAFQKNNAKDVEATYHFTFTGKEAQQGTIAINKGELQIDKKLIGKPNLAIVADSEAWIAFSKGELNILKALITGKIKFKGNLMLMKSFGDCFKM